MPYNTTAEQVINLQKVQSALRREAINLDPAFIWEPAEYMLKYGKGVMGNVFSDIPGVGRIGCFIGWTMNLFSVPSVGVKLVVGYEFEQYISVSAWPQNWQDAYNTVDYASSQYEIMADFIEAFLCGKFDPAPGRSVRNLPMEGLALDEPEVSDREEYRTDI